MRRVLLIAYGCGHEAPVVTSISSSKSEAKLRESAMKGNCGACAPAFGHRSVVERIVEDIRRRRSARVETGQTEED